MKVQDTLETTLKYLEIGHRLHMLVIYSITHTVINRSHEEHMNQAHAKYLLHWKPEWTWGHHAHLVEVKYKLRGSGSYSVKSPVDLMRLLGNADRHLNRDYKSKNALRALLDEFPLIHCLTASLLPFLDGTQIGVDDEQRALAKRHLEENSEWQEFFTPADDVDDSQSRQNWVMLAGGSRHAEEILNMGW